MQQCSASCKITWGIINGSVNKDERVRGERGVPASMVFLKNGEIKGLQFRLDLFKTSNRLTMKVFHRPAELKYKVFFTAARDLSCTLLIII